MSGTTSFAASSCLVGIAVALFAMPAVAAPIDDLVGCWVSEAFTPTSLLKDASDPASASVAIEKMWLSFDRIEETEHLVLGHLYEWDEAGTYVLGPTYQNGAYNPAAGFLTFGFPQGGLDHVTQSSRDELLYVHTKSASLSAMSVRPLKRIDCAEAKTLEQDLLERQKALKERSN